MAAATVTAGPSAAAVASTAGVLARDWRTVRRGCAVAAVASGPQRMRAVRPSHATRDARGAASRTDGT
eukprot:836154-Prymnesium_polylepis.1